MRLSTYIYTNILFTLRLSPATVEDTLLLVHLNSGSLEVNIYGIYTYIYCQIVRQKII